DATQIFALDDRGLEAELGGANGGDIAAWARTDNDNIEAGICHYGDLLTGGAGKTTTGPGLVAGACCFKANRKAARATKGGQPKAASDVAARAQVLVQKVVIAIDIGLGGGGQLFALGRSLHLGLRASAVEPVELLADRAAALAGGQRPCARIAAITTAVFCTADKGRQRARQHDHPKRFAYASGHASLLRSHRVAPPAATNHRGAANSTG